MHHAILNAPCNFGNFANLFSSEKLTAMDFKYKYRKYKTKYLQNRRPKYIIIGTVHDTQQERKIFEKLDKYTIQNPDYKWFCEGEPDYRNCKTLKDYKTHLVTDCLFVYMILQDLKKNPQDSWLRQELLDRFIELLITTTRIPNKNKFAQIFAKFPHISGAISSIEKENPIKQSTLKTIEINFKKQPEFITDLDVLLTKVCARARICGFIKDKDWDVIQKFLQNTNCKPCEDYIFMQMRDHAFLNIIGRVVSAKKVNIITVGSAHVPFLAKHLERIGQVVKIVTL